MVSTLKMAVNMVHKRMFGLPEKQHALVGNILFIFLNEAL